MLPSYLNKGLYVLMSSCRLVTFVELDNAKEQVKYFHGVPLLEIDILMGYVISPTTLLRGVAYIEKCLLLDSSAFPSFYHHSNPCQLRARTCKAESYLRYMVHNAPQVT